MQPEAKGIFLRKIVTNGFSIEEKENKLILRPRGGDVITSVTIEEAEPNVWKVVEATAAYAGFARGKKRSYFETYLNQWAAEATLQAPG